MTDSTTRPDPYDVSKYFEPQAVIDPVHGGTHWIIQFYPQMHLCDNCGKTGYKLQETVVAHVILCKECNSVFEVLDRNENGMELTECFVSAITARRMSRD